MQHSIEEINTSIVAISIEIANIKSNHRDVASAAEKQRNIQKPLNI